MSHSAIGRAVFLDRDGTIMEDWPCTAVHKNSVRLQLPPENLTSAAPSALICELIAYPGLTAGPIYCRPFGPHDHQAIDIRIGFLQRLISRSYGVRARNYGIRYSQSRIKIGRLNNSAMFCKT
jgi:hypothetical protein